MAPTLDDLADRLIDLLAIIPEEGDPIPEFESFDGCDIEDGR